MIKTLTLEERIEQLEKVLFPVIEFSGEITEKGKKVNRAIKDKGISKGEELAIIRKAVMCLITKHNLENDSDLQEFVSYFNNIEAIKEDVESDNKHD